MSVFIFYEKTNCHQSADKNNLSPHLAATLLLRQPCNTATLFYTATLSIQPHCCHGHFILAQSKAQSVIFLFKESV